MSKDKIMLFALIIKSVTGILGASLILTENHPYFTLTVLAIGAGINELLIYYKNQK